MPIEPVARSRFATVVRLALAAGLAIFVASNVTFASTALAGLTQVALLPAAIGVGLSIVAMANRGQLNRPAHQAAGLIVEPGAMTRTAAVSFAANKIIKSGGASGLAVFVRHGRRRGLPSGTVTAACALAAASSFTALGVLLSSTVIILAATGQLTGWWIAAAGGFGVYSAGALTAGYVAVRSRPRALRFWYWIQRSHARIRRRPPNQTDASVVEELYDALALATCRPRWTGRMVGHAIASKALGAMMLMAATHAAGAPISVASAIVIYATALAASLVSIIPAGVGVVEASTAAMLIGTGTPVPVAALSVALFRIFDLWLPVATGAFIGRKDFRSRTSRNCDATAKGSTRPGPAPPRCSTVPSSCGKQRSTTAQLGINRYSTRFHRPAFVAPSDETRRATSLVKLPPAELAGYDVLPAVPG